MSSEPERLSGPGKSLSAEPPDAREFDGLVRSARARLKDAGNEVGLGPAVWRVLAKGHEIRNLGEYEGDLAIDERIVRDLVVAATRVSEALA